MIDALFECRRLIENFSQSFHAELHQYKHQVELFNQLTQKLIAVYQQDDTTRVKKMTETINQRYNNLNTRWVWVILISRGGKVLLTLKYGAVSGSEKREPLQFDSSRSKENKCTEITPKLYPCTERPSAIDSAYLSSCEEFGFFFFGKFCGAGFFGG